MIANNIKNRIRTLTSLLIVLCSSCADNTTYNERFFDEFRADKSTTINRQNKGIQKASTHYLNEPQLIEYVVDYSNQSSKSYRTHVQKICDYTKIPFATSNIKHWNMPNFKISSSVKIITIHTPNKLNNSAIKKLLNFIANGGTVFFSSLVTDERLNFFYGLHPNANFDYDDTSAGFKFVTPLIPNMNNRTINASHIHYGLKPENFTDEVTPLLVAANNQDYGAILERRIGNGRVVFFNSELMIDKFTRGLIHALYLPSLEGVPYPVPNVSTIYLDDFPSPVYGIMKEPIASELGMTMDKFVDAVWWPDMQQLAADFNIDYTTTITFDYNTKVTPPFIFTEWERTKKSNTHMALSEYFTKAVLHDKHELALHGFNHVSLTKNDWKNPDFMSTALQTVKKKWQVESYGKLPVSYIPPSNIIDSTGLEKLHQSLPTVNYLCSSYFGELKEGSDREFDVDPYNSHIFDYPRITSEYELNEEKLFVKESVYAFTGIWSHFVHPDDVYQIKDKSNAKTSGDYDYRNANGYGWHTSKDGSDGLFPRFKQLLQQHKNTYPLSKFITAEQGGKLINLWRSSDFYHQNTAEYYTVKKKGMSYLKTHYWFVFSSKNQIKLLENYLNSRNLTFYKTPMSDGYLVNIATENPILRIPKFKLKTVKNELYVNAMEAYQNQLLNIASLHEDMSVKQIEVDEEALMLERLNALESEMFLNQEIDSTVWNTYAKLSNWLEKPQDVWQKLDQFYKLNPSLKTAEYSNELAKIVWYPNASVHTFWLLEQIKFQPNNISLLEAFVKANNTEENSEKIKEFLKRIADISNSKDAKKNYIKHILWHQTDDAYQLLAAVTPSQDYNDIADDVAWFYYEKENIEKASKWAMFTNDIDIAIKLDWLYILGDFKELTQTYNSHMAVNPNDDKTRVAMAYIQHGLGHFKEAWLLTNEISDAHAGKQPLVKLLNNDVKYVPLHLQKSLINEHSQVFKKGVKDSLVETIRLKTANSIVFNGNIASDRSNNTSFEKTSSYLIKDSKQFTHGISFTNSDIYALNTSVIDSDNVDKELFGLQYKISNPIVFEKLQYWSKARIEKDRSDQMFYHFGVGTSLSRVKAFTSLQYNIHPVKNGVAYNARIYRNKLGLYHEHHLNKAVTVLGYAEGNYYSNDVSSISLTGKLQYHLLKKPKVKLYPFLESTYSSATLNQPNGYPYWVVNNRLYGGGGIGGKIGIEGQSKFLLSADAAHFSDDYSGYFTRFNSRLSIRFLKYYVFQTSAEYYIQSKYYSNQFNFGLHYYLK